MVFSITYCMQWNYEPQAVSLAARLKAEFATEVELIAAGGGLFEVSCNERVVYSKKQTGNFPNEDELIAALSSW